MPIITVVGQMQAKEISHFFRPKIKHAVGLMDFY